MASDEFEREKLCFIQNSETVRSLNQIMWQIPLVAMTLTGGIWYGVSSTAQLPLIARNALLLFVTMADILLIIVIWRVREVMEHYIVKARNFYPSGFPDTNSKIKICCLKNKEKIVVKVFSLILIITAIASLLGVFFLPEASLNKMHTSSSTECADQWYVYR